MKAIQIIGGVGLATVLIVGTLYLNNNRPIPTHADYQPDVQYVRASGKCVECHRNETSGIVAQFEMSVHVRKSITCFDCHRPAEGQTPITHKGFQLASKVTAKNCAQCHQTEYRQFARSRHGGPAWAAVHGAQGFTPQQIAESEKWHPGTIKRPANALAKLEPTGAIESGCMGCHSIGKPNSDGSFGQCTECHSKHNPAVALARRPETCGQCHLGPDHSQYEIYSESKHGTLLAYLDHSINWSAPPKGLTTRDFPVPVCATCHMSGLEGLNVTHDVTERLSWYLFAAVSEKREGSRNHRGKMQELCMKCHSQNHVARFYEGGDRVVESTNALIKEAQEIVSQLRKQGYLTPKPFDEEIEFLLFDIWHYYGRTAKHGAFMGGADFVQWHGNYELFKEMNALKQLAKEIRLTRKKVKR